MLLLLFKRNDWTISSNKNLDARTRSDKIQPGNRESVEARRNRGARVGTSGLRPRSRYVIMIILSSCALKLRLPFSAGRASSRAYPP